MTDADDGGWGELFALAEGKVAEPVKASKSDKSPTPKKRKRQQRDQSHQTFDEYLKDRTKSAGVDQWPDWMATKGSLTKPSCHGWQNTESSSGESSACSTCGDSRLHHLIACTTKHSHLEVFCSVRNLRASAKLLVTDEELNVTTVKKIWKIFEQAYVRFASPEYNLLRSKCDAARPLMQRLLRIAGSSRSTKVDDAVRLIVACDAIYYQLYYLQITGILGGTGNFVPHPLQYFGLAQLAPNDAKKSVKEFTRKGRPSLPSKDFIELESRYGIDSDMQVEHPLSALHHFHFLESVTLFHESGWMSSDRVCEETWRQVKVVQEEHETPAPTLLSQWRDSSRDFLCHLYAYATVPDSSLERIMELLSQHKVRNGIIELGAGTGYLAQLLRQKGVKVEAYDICPTHKSDGNEYHGGTPPFVRVEKGNVGILSSVTGLAHKALLLCYPPPKSSMAYDALQRFVEVGGNVFIHVGEFKGLTGSTDFERYLQKKFHCVERSPCLTWGTDASEMTVWTKKAPNTPKSILLPCSCCRKAEATKRCRLQRYLQYCSKACFDDHASLRREHLRMSMIDDAKGNLAFENDEHFSSL
jgi:hypothetical protein